MKPLPILLGVVALFAAIGAIAWISSPKTSEAVVVSENGIAGENPLEIAEAGAHPKAVLDEELYDFGKMILGDEQSHTFSIRNEGEAPLRLEKKFVTCKCTVPTIPDEGIPPGESAEIVMTWKPLGPTDAFDKFAEIWTNDPENPVLSLKITGEVRELFQLRPQDPWTVSSLPEGEPTTFPGSIVSGLESFNIVNIETTADWLTVEPRPMELSELEKVGDGMASGYILETTVRPEMNVGRFHERISVETDLEEGHRVDITVVGTRPGPFSIIGQEWVGRDMTVRMGEVASADGKSITLSLFVPPGDVPLELTSVTSKPEIANVTLKRDDTFPAKVKEKYDITFSLPPGTPIGRYADGDRIEVRLTTNRENMAEINLSINAIVK